jgi:hypothetical protein
MASVPVGLLMVAGAPRRGEEVAVSLLDAHVDDTSAAPHFNDRSSGMAALVDAFQARRTRALAPHDETSDSRHRARGKADARQRIEWLLDEGTFTDSLSGLLCQGRCQRKSVVL